MKNLPRSVEIMYEWLLETLTKTGLGFKTPLGPNLTAEDSDQRHIN